MQARKPEFEMAYLSDEKTLNVARLEYTQKLDTEYTALKVGGTEYNITKDLGKKFHLGTDIVFLECMSRHSVKVFIASLSKGIFMLRPLYPDNNYIITPDMGAKMVNDFNGLVARTGYYYSRKLTSQFDKPSYDGNSGKLTLTPNYMMQFKMNQGR